ncbi:hypothetical protein [Caudoviricetes sp.]|nr:hypothetical protein [Caudoviricetes sp.]UOF81017.1 hypothetical protein [Caudoviricetes sp.]UOF81413.1 hypothetical protein [Caudoviricetes sp.]
MDRIEATKRFEYISEEIRVILEKGRKEAEAGNNDTAEAFLAISQALSYILSYFMEKEQERDKVSNGA